MVCVVEFQYQFEYGVGGVVIQVVGWFVVEYVGWMIDQCVCYCSMLVFVIGQFVWFVVQVMVEVDCFQQCVGLVVCFGYGGVGQQYWYYYVFQCGEFWQQVMELVDEVQCLVVQYVVCGI